VKCKYLLDLEDGVSCDYKKSNEKPLNRRGKYEK
jgi:hypothetical protein